eukprot:6053687-Prymnesium_polylepis.1
MDGDKVDGQSLGPVGSQALQVGRRRRERLLVSFERALDLLARRWRRILQIARPAVGEENKED